MILKILILINFTGALFGFYYYNQQLSETPFLLWVFVMDSPLYVFLFAFVLSEYILRKSVNSTLAGLASFGLIKVGFWTVFVILYVPFFLSYSAIYYLILLFLHIGMILESFILLRLIDFKKLHIVPVVLWFLLSDFMDYFMGLVPHPIPFVTNSVQLLIIAIESFVATLLIGLWFWKKSITQNFK